MTKNLTSVLRDIEELDIHIEEAQKGHDALTRKLGGLIQERDKLSDQAAQAIWKAGKAEHAIIGTGGSLWRLGPGGHLVKFEVTGCYSSAIEFPDAVENGEETTQ